VKIPLNKTTICHDIMNSVTMNDAFYSLLFEWLAFQNLRRLPLVTEHGIRLLSELCHLWLMANVTFKAQAVMEKAWAVATWYIAGLLKLFCSVTPF